MFEYRREIELLCGSHYWSLYPGCTAIKTLPEVLWHQVVTIQAKMTWRDLQDAHVHEGLHIQLSHTTPICW
jgi:hypothetical protein